MTMTIGGTSGLVFPDSSTQNTAATGFGFKNRLINGAMMIDQRNAGASVSVTSSNPYTLDRWQALSATAGSKYTVQQSSTAPAGFVNSLLVTSSSSYTVGSSEYFFIRQKIEGLNMTDLGWGTADAQPVTLSFRVRSSLTGTFGGSFRNGGQSRCYPFSYTINAANTWETKTITVAGDTTGTWLTTNGIWTEIDFSLGVGSTYSGTANTWASADYVQPTGATSVVGTNGATFYITGVQLEKGSTATSFDYRPYGTELALCQRYYEVIEKPIGVLVNCYNSSSGYGYIGWNVTKRSQPTVTMDTTASNWSGALLYANNGGRAFTGISVNNTSITNIQFIVNSSSTFTGGQVGHIDYTASNGAVRASAEL